MITVTPYIIHPDPLDVKGSSSYWEPTPDLSVGIKAALRTFVAKRSKVIHLKRK